jgi:hypothetical protein
VYDVSWYFSVISSFTIKPQSMALLRSHPRSFYMTGRSWAVPTPALIMSVDIKIRRSSVGIAIWVGVRWAVLYNYMMFVYL